MDHKWIKNHSEVSVLTRCSRGLTKMTGPLARTVISRRLFQRIWFRRAQQSFSFYEFRGYTKTYCDAKNAAAARICSRSSCFAMEVISEAEARSPARKRINWLAR